MAEARSPAAQLSRPYVLLCGLAMDAADVVLGFSSGVGVAEMGG